jgi:hypothetical protein
MGIIVTTAPAMYGPSAPEPSFLDSLPALGQPNKRHTWMILLIITLAFILVGIAGWVAIVLGTGRALNGDITVASTEASQSHQAEDDRSAPRKVKPGEAFTVGGHKALSGWKVMQDTSIGGAHFNVTGKVKNVSGDTSTAFIHFKFIDSSGEVLGTVQCNSADLKPGQTQALNCIPDGKYGNYKRVTVEAAS